ncbi:hypothetical protein [Clostridium sp.]|nr:hypothetical protein [Clostridium sp.]MDU6522153.1 hypothetical protein [Clostridium sp.]
MYISVYMLFIIVSTIISVVGIIYLVTSFKKVNRDVLDNSKEDKKKY